MNIPAHLNRNRTAVGRTIVSSFGSALPPHVSIRGGRFRQVDAAGNERMIEQTYIDCIIIAVNPNVSRIYYPGAYDPDTSKPPACFSDNGIAPSTRASEPQASRCDVCPQSKWGSAVSFKGKPVPACQNGVKLALLFPGDPICYMLRVPPNSINPVKAYARMVVEKGFDVSEVVTRVSFSDAELFTLQFAPAPVGHQGTAIITEDMAVQIARMDESGAIDSTIGLDDRPIEALADKPRPVSTTAAPQPATAAQQLPAPPDPFATTQTAQQAAAPRGRGKRKEDPPAQVGTMPELPAFLQRTPAPPPAAQAPAETAPGIRASAPAPHPDLAAALDAAFKLPV